MRVQSESVEGNEAILPASDSLISLLHLTSPRSSNHVASYLTPTSIPTTRSKDFPSRYVHSSCKFSISPRFIPNRLHYLTPLPYEWADCIVWVYMNRPTSVCCQLFCCQTLVPFSSLSLSIQFESLPLHELPVLTTCSSLQLVRWGPSRSSSSLDASISLRFPSLPLRDLANSPFPSLAWTDVEGTVNDPTPFPTPNKAHGSYHWTFERLLSAALVPLIASTAVTSVNPVLDGIICTAIVAHSHMVSFFPPSSRYTEEWGAE